MRLFLKIFLAVFISIFFVISLIYLVETRKEIYNAKEYIIEINKVESTFISRELKNSYIKSEWPLDSLQKLSQGDNFLFWWIVEENGNIYLADNNSFMGTNAYKYFPEIKNTEKNESLLLKQSYSVITIPLVMNKNRWSFWLGFSLKELDSMKKEAITLAFISVIISLTITGAIIYILIRGIIKPVKELTKATKKLKKGNLDCVINADTKDEIGELAHAFNDMRLGLKDRNDLLNSLLSTFKGKFGKVATILVRKNIQELAERNPRIKKILPKELGKSIRGG
jgi:methyl-accepting chemotaxis protein